MQNLGGSLLRGIGTERFTPENHWKRSDNGRESSWTLGRTSYASNILLSGIPTVTGLSAMKRPKRTRSPGGDAKVSCQTRRV